MSIGCEYYESLLLRLPDGDFTDAEAEALREHLRTCRDCRRLFKALEAAATALEDDQAEPPAELAENVMERVYAAKNAAAAKSSTTRRTKASNKRRWRNLAVAACLVLVVGGAAYFASNLLGRVGSSAHSAESIALDTAAVQAAEAPAAAEAAPEPEEAAGADMTPAAGEPMEEAAEAEFSMAVDIAADEARSEAAPTPAPRFAWPVTSWMEPAQVPEGMEEAFEAIITDSHEDASMTTAAWDVIAYVEYQGVIYEFLTDDGEEALLWRDAAEGLFPCLSPLTADALWALLD